MNRGRIGWAIATALLAAGLAVRLWHVATEPLWLDEAYSAYAAAHGFRFIWTAAPLYEAHPPFYYTLLRLWTLAFGDSLVALRALGIAAGLATLAVVSAAADEAGRLLGRPAGRRRALTLAAFALACLSMPLVEMSREVRPYPVMILAYAGATWAVLRLAVRARSRMPLASPAYAAYLLLIEAVLWLHNLGPLFAAALACALALAVARRGMPRADLAWLAGGHLLVLLLYLPALRMLADQAHVWAGSTWLRFALAGLPDRLASLYAVPDWPVTAAIALAGLAMADLRAAAGRRLAAILPVLAAMPVLAAILLSLTVTPVFLPRALAPAAVPALLLFATGASAFADRRRWFALAALAVLAANMLAVDLQARAAGPMQHWREAVAWLRPRFRTGDVVFAYPNEGALPLAYALRDAGLRYPVRAIPTPVPSFDPAGRHPSGYRAVVALPSWRLREIADAPATRAVPTIWLLRLGPPAIYDPGDVFLRLLHRDRRIVRSFRYGPIEITGLSRRPAQSNE